MNSSLVTYTCYSPNCNKPRKHTIDTITIHCMAGQLTVEQCGKLFANESRQASSNYGVDYNGNVGLYVDECNRSWCSSNADNDNRAVTIEVASDSKAPYKVNEKAMASLILLVADICKRNGIKKLLWKNDKSLIGKVSEQNMTVHCWFKNKECPGEYLLSKHGFIADEVNKLLDTSETAYYPKYQGKSNSYFEALKELSIDTSKENRLAIAIKNGLNSYQFSATQNLMLFNLLKNGKLLKV